MTVAYGGCIEPGGMVLDDSREMIECPVCSAPAQRHHAERSEGGSLNCYSSISCRHCGHEEGAQP